MGWRGGHRGEGRAAGEGGSTERRHAVGRASGVRIADTAGKKITLTRTYVPRSCGVHHSHIAGWLLAVYPQLLMHRTHLYGIKPRSLTLYYYVVFLEPYFSCIKSTRDSFHRNNNKVVVPIRKKIPLPLVITPEALVPQNRMHTPRLLPPCLIICRI